MESPSQRAPAPARGDADVTLVAPRPSARPVDAPPVTEPARATAGPLQPLPDTTAAWPAFVAGLKLTGMAAQLAAQTELKSVEGNALTLALPASHKHLADKAYADKLKAALDAATGRKVLLAFEIGDSGDGSLAAQERASARRPKRRARPRFATSRSCASCVERFSATVRPDSMTPLCDPTPSTKQEPS